MSNKTKVVLGREIKEIVYCRAKTCRSNKGRGKCEIVHPLNGDDKISVNAQGTCENFFTE
jgi:hypothetical protein